MSAVDAPQRGGGGRHKKKHKSKKRLGVRIDMTPMVDVAWLLLTFFILTTTFSKPQAMEINLPPDNKVKVETAESNLLTIRVSEKSDVFKNYGIDQPEKVTMTDIHTFLAEQIKEKPKLTVLLKVDRKARYHMTVDILDELQIAKINRFSLQPLTEEDFKILSKIAR
jgi:biopolymer transport protein ExbD